MTTTWNNVSLTRARTLEGLKEGERMVVYKGTDPDTCCNVWAPEIHNIDGTWHIYFAAGGSPFLDQQRLYVLEGGRTPWGTYKFVGRLNGANNWGIDGTVSIIHNKRYFIWSCIDKKVQSLCIALMTSPSTLAETHVISHPDNGWERMQGRSPVNEGPAVMQRNGKVFLTYSASSCFTNDYSLGLLTLKPEQDPLIWDSWVKTGPVFKTAYNNYGPGHNGFFYTLLGGMTYEATSLYYNTINSAIRSRLGGRHCASLLLHSYDFDPILSLMLAGNWEEVTSIFTTSAISFKNQGAKGLVICANYPHKIADEVEERSGLDVLHIADFTAQAVLKAGCKKVGLLGTKNVMEESYIKDRISSNFEIEVIVPSDQKTRDRVHQTLVATLTRGIVNEEIQALLVECARSLIERGAEGIILGSTDLAFALKREDVSVPLFDTNELHARGVAEWMIEDQAL
ncbi:hypothetical protein FKW77_005208 [Venturia effusa]|uniref:Uncharacterized protein n=1 Tax=Venturia effusa TaxID=50376 RepID=A0A517LCD7_9PEZI|nr:hypothetical protein FKW77_005208 [Venturia effusa]